jgi:hypothetical protein
MRADVPCVEMRNGMVGWLGGMVGWNRISRINSKRANIVFPNGC